MKNGGGRVVRKKVEIEIDDEIWKLFERVCHHAGWDLYERFEKMLADFLNPELNEEIAEVLEEAGIKALSNSRNGKVPVQIDKQLFKFVKKVCDWTGWDVAEFIEDGLITRLEGYLDDLSATVPKAGELLKELKEIRASL